MKRLPPGPLHIVVLGAQPEYLSGLRGPMIREFIRRGHRVTAIGAEEMPAVRASLESWGAHYLVAPIRRAGLNPFSDIRAIWKLFFTLRKSRADIVFAYTIKPIVFGLPLSWLAGISRRYAMVSGRGYALMEGQEPRRRIARSIVTFMYKFALRFANGVIFHNEDDRQLFADSGMLGASTPWKRVFGSGVDLEQFTPTPLPTGKKTFVMISRLLKDKGVADYVAASRILKNRGIICECQLVGPFDHSPNAIDPGVIQQWVDEGLMSYHGATDDVRPFIARSHVLVLPSRGEGMPRTVLEAMAMRRAIITNDAPGCRDTIPEQSNGILVEPGNIVALADAMLTLISDDQKLDDAAKESLRLARDRFDVVQVNRSICDFMNVQDITAADSITA